MIRSRITPNYGINSDHMTLVVDLKCLDRGNNNPIFNLNVRYSVSFDGETWDSWWDYGTFGVGPEDYMIDAIKDSVEFAVTNLILAH